MPLERAVTEWPSRKFDSGEAIVFHARMLAAAICAQPALAPGVLALEITEDLEAALAQFAEIAADLRE